MGWLTEFIVILMGFIQNQTPFTFIIDLWYNLGVAVGVNLHFRGDYFNVLIDQKVENLSFSKKLLSLFARL